MNIPTLLFLPSTLPMSFPKILPSSLNIYPLNPVNVTWMCPSGFYIDKIRNKIQFTRRFY